MRRIYRLVGFNGWNNKGIDLDFFVYLLSSSSLGYSSFVNIIPTLQNIIEKPSLHPSYDEEESSIQFPNAWLHIIETKLENLQLFVSW